MSKQNVEVVRRFVGAMQRFFEAYWKDPRSIAEALETETLWPEYQDALSSLDPEFEWKTVFLGGTHRGYLDTARVWDDYLAWASDYRIVVSQAEDLGENRVYAVIGLTGTPKTGGAPMEAEFFDVFTLGGGRIVQIEEYTDRDSALEAARLAD
jgi:ketosteroid isomerase-like protein